MLVVAGEPGVGKSALLDYAARQAQGWRVARAVGVQSEMELAFAGLHQLWVGDLDSPGGVREAAEAAGRTRRAGPAARG